MTLQDFTNYDIEFKRLLISKIQKKEKKYFILPVSNYKQLKALCWIPNISVTNTSESSAAKVALNNNIDKKSSQIFDTVC